MSEHDSLEAFTGKWRARWPEWRVAEVFVPASQRDRAVAWLALLEELAESAWGGGDAAPGLAKLAWWQEELRGWSRGARRHPLGLALQPTGAPWQALADALPVLRDRALVQGGLESLQRGVAPLAVAAADVEAALFGAPAQPDRWALSFAGGHLPAQQLASAAQALGAARGPASRVRRLFDAGVRLRLGAAADAGSGRAVPQPSRWRLLLAMWRAARD